MRPLRSFAAAGFRRGLLPLLFLAALLPARASLDVSPPDGIPDIWALRYGSGALSPTADTDGDGQTNSAEAAAGTNPAQVGSVIRITSVAADAGGVHLTFPTEQGKRYQVQTAVGLVNPVWTDLGTPLAPDGTGSLAATNNAAGATNLFYRVRVQDTDSDGDGVSDWEEMQIGFDPYNSHSKGPGAVGDLAAITAALSAVNVVSVSSSGVPITEPPAANVSTETGTFTIKRTGNLNAITVNYTVSGGATAGSDYTALPGSVTLGLGVNSATVTVTPLPDAVLESREAVILTISPSASYTVGSPAAAAVLINDYTQANGTGLAALFWEEGANVNLNQTVLPTFTGTAVSGGVYAGLNQTTASWGSPNANGTHPVTVGVTDLSWSSRWTGEVLPQYSQIYTFSLETNFAGRLYVGGQLVVNNWPPVGVLKSSSDSVGTPTSNRPSGTIELVSGTRYPIIVEHFQDGGTGRCYLRWQSSNQPEEYIPATRLFPAAPPQIISPLSVLLLKNSPLYHYQIVASANPASYGAVNLPPGWTIDTATGDISGVPTQMGTWQVPITATNALGSGSAILEIQVIATDSLITRDVWTGILGNAVSSIPLTTAPTGTASIPTLETAQSVPDADNFGARIRGHLTAPSTGVYKFWLTASNAAELYISDDDEVANSFKRAQVTAATGYREWAHANTGKSPLLWLTAGKRYYVEVRHKAGVGSDHVSVGWIKPGEGGTDPASYQPANGTDIVVPGYALSTYVAPAPVSGESTLYAATLTAQSTAVTSGYGSGSLRLSADETQAIVSFSYSNLTSPVLQIDGKHVHCDPYLNHPRQALFPLENADQQPDGSWVWDIGPVGTFTSAAAVVDAIKAGVAYLNIHTDNYPTGEIRGNFRFQAASQTFTAPAAQTWTDPASAASPESYLNRNGAARFLVQSTFGASAAEVSAVQTLGFGGWIDAQLGKPVSQHYPYVFANRTQTDPNGNVYPNSLTYNAWWKNSVTAPDQLRQRVASALSEILVISTAGPLTDNAATVSDYYDMLLANAFGNVRTLLQDVTLHPAMGRYLDMLRNDKPDKTTGRIPNENYAREIKQLFSIGLNRMHPDGSLMLNSKGELIPTYDQDAIIGFAHVFTGWDYFYTGAYRTYFGAGSNWTEPMREVPLRHFTGQKRLLNNVVLPGLPVLAGVPLDPYAAHSAAQYGDPAYQALPALEMGAAHDALFNHPNCGPFLCRQLIQRLVTSTPSRGYLYRVVQKFNDNGSGVRGDMVAIVKAILLDREARSATLLAQQGFGKQREPVMRVAAVARAFPAPAPVTGSYTQTGNLITVTTGAPHLYATGNSAFLDFSGGVPSDPDDAAYGVTLDGVSPATKFSVRPLTSQGVTYSQTGGTITVTETDTHNYNVGESVYLDFTSGAPDAPADGFYTVATDDPVNIFFTVNQPTTKTATYSQTGSTITLTSTAHGFANGASVFLDFPSGTPSAPAAGLYTVAGPTADTFTVTAADAVDRTGSALATPAADAASRTGAATMTKAAYAVNRSGSVAVNYSDWGMGSTDTDLNQTPLNSPTVFNFFLPDYQFPGLLGQAGLITPEFQLTSETSVIRQANFLYSGLFNDGLGQSGLSSFKSGARDIFADLRPWMGTGPGGLPWAHNSNLGALVDELNTLLMGGQMPAAAKAVIVNFAQTLPPSTQPIVNILPGSPSSNPCELRVTGHGLAVGDTITISGVTGGTFSPPINGTFQVVAVNSSNRFTVASSLTSSAGLSLTGATILPALSATTLRDRVRAIVHLLITSPDFTIQK